MNNNVKTEGMGTKPAMYFKYVSPQVKKKTPFFTHLEFLKKYISKKKEIYRVKIKELLTLSKN